MFISQASFMSETVMKLAYEPPTVYIETPFGLDSEMRGNDQWIDDAVPYWPSMIFYLVKLCNDN